MVCHLHRLYAHRGDVMNEITYLIPKAAQEVVEEIKKQHEYDVWLNELVDTWKEINDG